MFIMLTVVQINVTSRNAVVGHGVKDVQHVLDYWKLADSHEFLTDRI